MPNWCYNIVMFTGDAEKIKQVEQLFYEMQIKQKVENCGHIPDFMDDADRYFFNVRWEFDMLYYDTKWASNVEELKTIADKFNVGFVYDYSETAMYVYGRATYENGILKDIWLDEDDFESYQIIEGSEYIYLFEGEKWFSEDELLDHILERKIALANI